jgi:hypothetical protein
MWTSDLFRPFKLWLIETGIILVGALVISIAALYVHALELPEPLGVFYLTGAVCFGILFGRCLERWSRSRQ